MGAPRGGWKLSAADERNRRSVYIFVRRNTRYPMLEAFDMPDTHESCSRRNVTTTAPQALTMLNDKVALRVGAGLRRRVRWPRRTRCERAFRLAYSRHARCLGEGHGRDVLPQAEGRDRRARGAGREAGAARRDAGRRGAGVRRGVRRLLPDAAELERICLSELDHETSTHMPARSRREFLDAVLRRAGRAGALVSMLQGADARRIRSRRRSRDHTPTAKSVIWLFMEGGPSHIDLFDPKPELQRLAGQPMPRVVRQSDHRDGHGDRTR